MRGGTIVRLLRLTVGLITVLAFFYVGELLRPAWSQEQPITGSAKASQKTAGTEAQSEQLRIFPHSRASEAAATASAKSTGMMGKQGMMGGKGMMEHMQAMHMPAMMPYCPCMAGMGGMKTSPTDLANSAKMMQMQAEMMKANAEIMEKYAKQMQTGK
jgi:hypothetical protein